jgi:membrane protein involved in colicin uptake
MEKEVIDITPVAIDITKDLVKFNVTEADIRECSEKYLPLVITDLSDKGQYEAVHAAKMDMVKRRTTVTGIGKELRAKALEYQRVVIAEEKRLVELMGPIEAHLTAEEQKVKDEKERLKRVEAEKEAARIQARVDRVCAFGATFDGQQYTVAGISLPHALLKVANNDQFEMFLGNIQKNVEAEKARIAEEARLKKEEEERQEAERVRLEDENRKLRIEQERIKAEQDAVTAQKAEEAKKLQAELDEMRKERDRLEADKKAKEVEEQNKIAQAQRAKELEAAKKEAAAKAIKDAEEKAQKAKEAAERKAARQPDKIKILLIADTLDAIQTPDVKTEDGKAVALAVMMLIAETVKKIRDQVEEEL